MKPTLNSQEHPKKLTHLQREKERENRKKKKKGLKKKKRAIKNRVKMNLF